MARPGVQDLREQATILIVEDEPAIRRIAADILRDDGYFVLECTTATEAMVLISAQKVDLIFSDVLMPGSIGGLTLAGWVKTNRPKTPVVLCSGISAVSRYLQGREGISFLEKPFSSDDLLRIVRRALDVSTNPQGR